VSTNTVKMQLSLVVYYKADIECNLFSPWYS